MGLAETHYLSNREEALKWSDMAIEEARQLNDYEFLSLGLGLKCFLYFMMAEADDFYKYESMLEDLRSEYQERYDAGSLGKRQTISHRFDAEIKVAHCAFNGDFAKAFELAEDNAIATPNLVKFRLYAMQGTYEKSKLASRLRWWLIGLTLVYVFVYIMGRRRLMRKIWKKTDELKAALKRADDASKMKSVFIRSMSHEIRTPLNAINGFTQVLCSPAFTLTEQEKNDLRDRVSSNTDAITIIINELLEIAAGDNVKLNPDELRNVCVNRVCNMAMAEAKKNNVKNLELSFTTELTDDFTIKSNAETVSQILSKIIDNAMKFTDKGSVEVSANAIGRNVEISVTDTGIGIPDEKRDAIFESFVKLDDFRGGIGLGLSICRRLARTLGGNVILDPKYKNGSRFILQLPIEFGA
jgi:signal transduction histidine kinase